MKGIRPAFVGVVVVSVTFLACHRPPAEQPHVMQQAHLRAEVHEPSIRPASGKGLEAFASNEDLKTFFDDMKSKQQALARRAAASAVVSDGIAATTPAPSAKADKSADKAEESITNTQTVGVDEGGIVKVHGKHLVVLRRGRLFTVAIGDNQLKPISSANAYGAELDPSGAWYDEMLIDKNTVVVIGYSYQRGGTEVGLFDLDDEGTIAHRATYHLRSNDYYSSRNYASRLVGDKLIFYSPLYVNTNAKDPREWMPAVRKWKPNVQQSDFVSILEPTKMYKPLDEPDGSGYLALHTVTSCDLSEKRDMKCSATAVMAPPGRVFYVSQKAVYVWTTPYTYGKTGELVGSKSQLYRMPLDGGDPTVLRTKGSPIDQFSFLEEDDGHLNVVLRADGNGEAMWSSEAKAGDLALMRIGIGSFDKSANEVAERAYSSLPTPSANAWALQNRFVGDRLVYGVGYTWNVAQTPESQGVYVRPIRDTPTKKVKLTHGVDRIEQLGHDAIVVGSDGKDLHFSALALDEGEPRIAGAYVEKSATQGETRSHGFFYKPDGDRKGVFGLPIMSAGSAGYSQLTRGSASILFVKNDGLAFKDLGALASTTKGKVVDDHCKASCVDWYGNARPIFLKGRVFALLGYELVEGQLEGTQIHEKRRVDFAPR